MFADLEQSSFRSDNFFGSSFLSKLRVLASLFEEHSPFVEIKPHIHILRVYGHKTLTAIPPQTLTVISPPSFRYAQTRTCK